MGSTLHLNGPLFRPELAFSDHSYIEKRQLFLRSYQFCRKRTLLQRFKLSLVQIKRVVWVRLRAARKLHRFVWQGMRSHRYGRKRFHRLANRSLSSTNVHWISLW